MAKNLLTDLGVPDAASTPEEPPQEVSPAMADQDPLMSNPVVAAVLNADVPGVTASPEDFNRPEVKFLGANNKQLLDLGLGLYRSKDKSVSLFNPGILRANEVEKLDQHGKLRDFFVPASQFFGAASNPAPAEGQPPAAGGLPSSQPLPRPTPSAAQRPIAEVNAKSYGVAQRQATKRPQPGSGSLLQTLEVQSR